ncbi:TMEM43 family protein [Pararhizobium sp. BT-229]|uniref:TMEM43 family protein n=1 Tax=Pararhizobium sp. BT-229 TaxID=2986923 RepID=UPI0021F73FB1|nr:TMEM43 family protein [Pararhizobium sp. BT-229]MCV9962172.1 TMEM43 family protein [Pararhizobium sp. BT-229]
MSFTETTTTSWFSRLKNGLAGLVIGPILVIGMIWLLSWNEGRSVQTYRALAEGAGIVVSLDSGTVDPANEGKLVHISGPVKPDGTPEDPALGVSAEGAAGLNRKVEMYQWVEEKKSETQKTLGGGEETVTTYSYQKEWRPRRVNSSDFRQADQHQNPDMPIEGERFTVATAALGAFTVDGRTVANLGTDSPVRLSPDVVAQVTSALGSEKPVRADGTTVYVSQNRQSPAIGDLRISFSREDIAEASFVGAQKGVTIAGYKASNGRELLLSAAGRVTSADMFDAAQSENTLITWLVRVGGLLGMFIGFALMLSILGIIADVIPFVGSIVSFGTSIIAGILTLLLGPLVIAIAWIAYRPVLAITVIVIGILSAAAVLYIRRKKAVVPPTGSTATFGRT